MCVDKCVIPDRIVEKLLILWAIMCIRMLFICTKRFIEKEVIYSYVALHLTNCLGLIKINVHYILIIIECHVYIVVLNVLYGDVYMYKSLQIKFLFCSVDSLDKAVHWLT